MTKTSSGEKTSEHTLIVGKSVDGISTMWGSTGQKVAPIINAAGVLLEEVCCDTETAMVCAGYIRAATFPDRLAFIHSMWMPERAGPVRATELESFDVWVDDPQFSR